ncbi:MAG: hypothetical protein ACYDD4_03505 [Acidimicrobiales bacterium]
MERSNSRLKDPATTDIGRGFSRVMGLAPLAVFVACAVVERNLAFVDAFEARRADDEQRRRDGPLPRTRRRRRTSIRDLVSAGAPP